MYRFDAVDYYDAVLAAHKGISYCLNPDLELDGQATAEVEGRLDKMQPEAERLWQAIGNEAMSVLWFERIG